MRSKAGERRPVSLGEGIGRMSVEGFTFPAREGGKGGEVAATRVAGATVSPP